MPTPITHTSTNKTFTANLNGHQAVLEYHFLNPPENTIINFSRTYVPPECRGKGIAEALVREGLSWARAQGYEIRASCWYVEKFL